MAPTTWWELEVARLAAAARLLEGDDLIVSDEIARTPSSHLPRSGFVAQDALPEILAHVGAIHYPCPTCRLLVDIGERAPGETIHCPGCGGPFDAPVPETWSPPPRVEATDPAGLLGEIVDGIRFDRVLHQSDGVTVYRGWALANDRPVAAKSLEAGRLADPEATDRLRQEVGLAIDLKHPNLVGVLGLLARRGARILVMEFVDGTTAEALLDAPGPISPLRAIHVARAVGGALAYLHGRGIVHRDVKPGNVFLGLDAEVRLGDFELIERFRRGLEPAPEYLLGTPSYMAPEILQGAPPDPASDVYALGATLYHLLATVPPYDADDPVEIAVEAIRSAPAPLGAHRPDLPPSVGRVVDRLMARRPEARPASGPEVDDLLAGLERVLREKSPVP